MSQPDDQDFYSRYLIPQPADDDAPEQRYTSAAPEGGGIGAHTASDEDTPHAAETTGLLHLGGDTPEYRYPPQDLPPQRWEPQTGQDRPQQQYPPQDLPPQTPPPQRYPPQQQYPPQDPPPQRWEPQTGQDRPQQQYPPQDLPPQTPPQQQYPPQDPPPQRWEPQTGQDRPQQQYPPQDLPPQTPPPQRYPPQQQYPPQDPPPQRWEPQTGQDRPQQQYPPQDLPPQTPPPQRYPPQQERPRYPQQQYPPQQERPQYRQQGGDAAASDRSDDPDSGRHYRVPPVVQPPSSSVGNMRAEVRQADLVRPYKPVPEIGWRKRLHQVTRINAGVGPAEREWLDLKRRLRVNLRGTYFIAIMQQKGGVSKTTGTIGLGEALARYRDDKIVAIDANPANGNLASRVEEPSTGTWRSLIADPNLVSYTDFRHYLGKDPSTGLEVLGSDDGDEVLTGANLIQAWDKLSRQYPVGLIDCGNQMRDDVTAAVLSHVDAVVVVSTTRFDGASGAQNTLNWLIAHGYPHLVRSAVMMISNVNKVTPSKAVRNLHDDFGRVVRAVHDIPYDPHLSDATAINFDRLAPATRRAFIETAASVVDGFAGAADKDSGYRGNDGGRR